MIEPMLQPAPAEGLPGGESVPAYLSEALAGRFDRVSADIVCPFCGDVKATGMLGCFPCYGARLSEVDGGDIAILERREAELATAPSFAEGGAEIVKAEAPVADPVVKRLGDEYARRLTTRIIVFSMLALCGMTLVMIILGLTFTARRPRPVVVVRSEEQFVPQEVGEAAPAVTAEERSAAALMFVKMLFDVDAETRVADVKDALKMMDPGAAVELARLLRESGQLRREQSEGVRAWWQREEVAADPDDPFRVRLRGRQVVERPGKPKYFEEMIITVRLALDPAGRSAENQDTGLRVVGFTVDKTGGGTAGR